MSTGTHNSKITIKHLTVATLTCVVLLALLNVIAERIHDVIWYPSSYTHNRNLYLRRGWEHYTALPDEIPDDSYRLIIISNSQGFLYERRDSRKTYAYQLEALLEAQMQQPVQVLNWSAVATNAAEQIILAARAIAHEPDMVLWIAHNDNFSRAQHEPFTFYSTDIPRLVYDAAVRQYLSQDFLAYHNGYDPLEWIKANTGLGKLVHVLDSDREQQWWWAYQIEPFIAAYYPWNKTSVYYAQEFYDTLNRGAGQIPMAFVSMPLNPEPYSDSAWTEMVKLADRVNQVYQPLDVPVYDAVTLIPSEEFYTSTHMTPTGHRLFAEWLTQTVDFVQTTDTD